MAAKKGAANAGRPVKYTEAIFYEVLEKYAAGADICPLLESKAEYPTYNTFLKWMTSSEELFQLYTCARQGKTEPLIAKIHHTLEDLKNGLIDAPAARVMIDTWKWEICKYYPKLYGDKLDVTSGDKPIQSTPITVALDGQVLQASSIKVSAPESNES